MVLLLPAFGVRVSVTFHLTCAHIGFSLVWVSGGQLFGEIAAHSVDHLFSFYFTIFPVLVSGLDLGSDSFSSLILHTFNSHLQ